MNKIVFTNGVFDILHKGHLDLLRFCKEHGDLLIIAIDSDKRVRETKGNERPIFNQFDRKEMLESLRFVDKVIVFDSLEQLKELHRSIAPDIVVKGSDWKNKNIYLSDGIHEKSKLIFFPLSDGYSTTSIIKKIRN
jgi:D-beta-D-heptose 7-phosphate kinase/D-beta-D-heptose 1-phosphate adenosyltransferase